MTAKAVFLPALFLYVFMCLNWLYEVGKLASYCLETGCRQQIAMIPQIEKMKLPVTQPKGKRK